MSVHKAITKHVETQQKRIRAFHELEAKREFFIEEAIQKCKRNEPFSVNSINEVTKKINELAKEGAVPTRRLVSVEMVKEYVNK